MTLDKSELSIKVTYLNVFSPALSGDVKKDITNSERSECGQPGNYLRWNETKWNLAGNANELSIPVIDGPCQNEIPLKVYTANFRSAVACMQHCQKLGGRSPPVRTLMEWQGLTREIEAMLPKLPSSVSDEGNTTDFWLPVTDGKEIDGRLRSHDHWPKDVKPSEGVMRDFYTGQPLDMYDQHMLEDSRGHFTKMTYTKPKNQTGTWSRSRVGPVWQTIMCSCVHDARKQPHLHLRGLCPTSSLRTANHMAGLSYTLKQLQSNPDDLHFVGGMSSRIFYDNKWRIADANSAAHGFSVDSTKESYVLGKHDWTLWSDGCPNRNVTLKLTGCNQGYDGDQVGEFTCNDGQCVNMSQRFDQVQNCRDNSDEEECQLLKLRNGYNKFIPPFTIEEYTEGTRVPASVDVGITLHKVMSIDEVESTIDLKFEISLQWKDNRLTFNNLKEETYLNALSVDEIDSIWMPWVIYENTDQSQMTRISWTETGTGRSTTATVLREGNFTRQVH